VEWCDDTSKNTQFAIKTATSQKEKLEATIEKSADDSSAASAKIEDLAASIATDEADLKAATGIRNKENADFKASEAELADALDTLGRAIGILSKEMAKNPAAFAQVDTTNFNSMLQSIGAVIDAAAFMTADKQKITALLQSQQESDDEDTGAPAAAVYKSHSTNIVEVLEDMKEKAEGQLAALRKAETDANQAFMMLKGSLEAQIGADNKDLAEQKATKAEADETNAAAKGDLASTEKELADAKASLESANANCMTTAADHEATTTARTEELKVIAQAKQIVKESTGGAEQQSYSFVQLKTRADLKNSEVVTLVKKLARDQHSSALAQLASRITAVLQYGAGDGEDVFGKIKGLIRDMIAKLEKEAQADASEKAYCDEQLAKTEEKQTELEDDVKKLTVKIDEAASKSTQLKEEVRELQAELAALAKEQSEMDKIRSETHADFVVAEEDLSAGLAGVRKALGVLRDYYGGAAASMLQEEQPKVPEHSQSTGAGQSIISILEVCESDFAKDLTAEETEEADAQSEYDTLTQENAITKTTKDQDVKYKSQESTNLDKSIAELSADRTNENMELSAVNEYYAKIKDRCIAKPETYEERAKRREAEIAGLKEAQSILENETAFTQRSKRGHHFLGM